MDVLRVQENTWGHGCHLPDVLTLVPRHVSSQVFKEGKHSHEIYGSLSTILMNHRAENPRGKACIPFFE